MSMSAGQRKATSEGPLLVLLEEAINFLRVDILLRETEGLAKLTVYSLTKSRRPSQVNPSRNPVPELSLRLITF